MEIALNKESKRKTPVFISFRDNARLFGEDAQTLGLRYPTNCFGYLTDLIGKTIDNPVVKLYKYVSNRVRGWAFLFKRKAFLIYYLL